LVFDISLQPSIGIVSGHWKRGVVAEITINENCTQNANKIQKVGLPIYSVCKGPFKSILFRMTCANIKLCFIF
jgi:hypothetical protein